MFIKIWSVLTHKHFTRLERLARDKHSTLLSTFVNYGCKKLNNIGPLWHTLAAGVWLIKDLKLHFCVSNIKNDTNKFCEYYRIEFRKTLIMLADVFGKDNHLHPSLVFYGKDRRMKSGKWLHPFSLLSKAQIQLLGHRYWKAQK